MNNELIGKGKRPYGEIYSDAKLWYLVAMDYSLKEVL